MITVELNARSAARVTAMLRRKAPRILREVTTQMNRETVDLQTYIKETKLSGRPGLRNITGNLRRSIKRIVTTNEVAVTGTIGVGVEASKYARIHEFGGDIKIPAVEGKLMAFPGSGQSATKFTKSGRARRGLKAFGKDQLVFTRKRRAYTVHIPQRSFLRSSLAENRRGIADGIYRAVQRGILS